jgi:lipoprotein-anchoring transpeptidase ErfK/SrfK
MPIRLAAALFALALSILPALGDESASYTVTNWDHVDATVSLSQQRIHIQVYVGNSVTTYDWPVSTGRKGFETPVGKYGVLWADADHRSSIYENAPMPFAVFFNGGYAIHGTTEVAHLGKPASHGCVRLDPANAEILYNYVNEVGKASTRIVIAN